MPPTTLPATTEPAIIPCIYAACNTPAIFGGRESAGCSFEELFQQLQRPGLDRPSQVVFELTNNTRHDFGVWEVEGGPTGNWSDVASNLGVDLNTTQRLRFRPTHPWFGITSIPFLVKGKVKSRLGSG